MKDFLPDFFSMRDPQGIELSVSEKARLKTSIKKHFPNIGEPLSIQPQGGLGINSLNFLVITEKAKYSYKIWGFGSQDRIELISRILKHLFSKNIGVPVPIDTSAGLPYIRIDDTYSSLFTYIEGTQFTADFKELPNYFSSLSELFTGLKSFELKEPIFVPFVLDSNCLISSLSTSLENRSLWSTEQLDEPFDILKSIFPFLLNDLETYGSIQNLAQRQYSHFDLHPKNILKIPGGEFGFLDFEACGFIDPNIAWGFTLIKNLRQTMVLSKSSLDPAEAGVKSLESIQATEFGKSLRLESLPLFGRIEIVRRLAYILDEYKERNSKEWLQMLPVQVQLLKESYILFPQLISS